MKRRYLFPAVALILGGLIFAYSQAQRTATQTPRTGTTSQRLTGEQEISAQQRINRYFHGDVMSKLRKCWSNVRAKGTISLKYTYTKSDARWIFKGLEIDHSTLPSGQDTIAMKCMSDAVRGSSFSVDGVESKQSTFVLNWTWPVPFPANANQLTTAMFAARLGHSTESGCDGMGTPPKCYTCGEDGCIKVCVGYKECTVYAGNLEGHLGCLARDSCASGGPFGVSGSGIIY